MHLPYDDASGGGGGASSGGGGGASGAGGGAAAGRERAFVVTGACFAAKLNQTVAFLFGQQSRFEYHSQKGTCVVGSYLMVASGDSGAPTYICDKKAAKGLGQCRLARPRPPRSRLLCCRRDLPPTDGCLSSPASCF